jgi:glycosyltransferase involved in cell wall biosynthesis
MACGLAVVITAFGDNDRWLKDGEGGYTIPLQSPASLAECIIHLLKNPDMRKRFGQTNRETIQARSSFQGEMAKVEQLYRFLTEGRKGSSIE